MFCCSTSLGLNELGVGHWEGSKMTRYTFTVLRYVHDVVTGEFANVGVALYAPEKRYLAAECLPNYGRLSKFFGEVDGDNFRRLMHFFVSQFDGLSEELTTLPFHDPPSDVTGFSARVLPPDDSALQFSPAGGGLTEDPEATLAELYERYVLRYAERPHKPSGAMRRFYVCSNALSSKGACLPEFDPRES